MRTRWWIGGALALLLAACSGSAATHAAATAPPAAPASAVPSATSAPPTPAAVTPSPTPDLAALAQQYLAIASRLNPKIDAAQTELGANDTATQIAGFRDLAATMHSYATAILAVPWPVTIRPDAVTAATTAQKISAEAAGMAANANNPAGITAVLPTIMSDLATLSANVTVLRSDLQLPAAS